MHAACENDDFLSHTECADEHLRHGGGGGGGGGSGIDHRVGTASLLLRVDS